MRSVLAPGHLAAESSNGRTGNLSVFFFFLLAFKLVFYWQPITRPERKAQKQVKWCFLAAIVGLVCSAMITKTTLCFA